MLRLEIESRWEPEDFIEVMKGVESLYYKIIFKPRYPFGHEIYRRRWPLIALSFDEQIDLLNDWLVDQARSAVSGDSRLTVARIDYASPGSIDLVGLGEACRAIADTLSKLIDFFAERAVRREHKKQAAIETERKKVELEKERESLRALKIENAHRILALHRKYPEMDESILFGLIGHDQDKIIPRIAEGKIIRAAVTEGRSIEGGG